MAGTHSEGCSGPVAGLRVADFSRGFPGALTTMLLADYGADVVKVVGPEGDPLGTEPGFRVWNRGKRSVELDLRSGEGVEGAAGAGISGGRCARELAGRGGGWNRDRL